MRMPRGVRDLPPGACSGWRVGGLAHAGGVGWCVCLRCEGAGVAGRGGKGRRGQAVGARQAERRGQAVGAGTVQPRWPRRLRQVLVRTLKAADDRAGRRPWHQGQTGGHTTANASVSQKAHKTRAGPDLAPTPTPKSLRPLRSGALKRCARLNGAMPGCTTWRPRRRSGGGRAEWGVGEGRGAARGCSGAPRAAAAWMREPRLSAPARCLVEGLAAVRRSCARGTGRGLAR